MSSDQSDDSHDEGGQGDARSCSGSGRSVDESTTSNKSRDCSPDSSPGRSDEYSQDNFEDEKETPTVLNKSHLSTVKKPPKKTKGYYKGQKRPGVEHPHQKKTFRAGRKAPLFPPIKPLDGVGQRIASARQHRIKELSNQVWELQQQLNGAWQENRLLRRVQNRHTVALQQFQDSQSGLPQILQKHGNEVHALQELLRNTRVQRNGLARQLSFMETHLQQTSEELHRLQLLCQQRHLEEREELTQQLRKLQLDLEIKNKRILDLERNLELSSTSFSRHLNTEMRKTVEARELSILLQEQIDQLSHKIKEKERELEIHNIYAHRFPKKGAKETKSVQTEGLSPLPLEGPGFKLELEYESQEHLEKELDKQRSNRSKELSAIDFSKPEKDQNSTTESLAEDSELEDGAAVAAATVGTESGEEPSQQQADDDDDDDENEEANKANSYPLDLSQAETRLDLNDLQDDPSHLTTGKQSTPRIRRHYTFKETVQNLHRGRPAYGPQRGCRGPARAPSLDGDSAYEPSFLSEAAGRARLGEDPRSRKSSLMRELFGDADAAAPGAEGGSHGAKALPASSSDSDRTSAYILGDTASHIRDSFIIFD